jgi:hypothetical protein
MALVQLCETAAVFGLVAALKQCFWAAAAATLPCLLLKCSREKRGLQPSAVAAIYTCSRCVRPHSVAEMWRYWQKPAVWKCHAQCWCAQTSLEAIAAAWDSAYYCTACWQHVLLLYSGSQKFSG